MSDALKPNHSSDNNNAQTDQGDVKSADHKLVTAPLRFDVQEFCSFIEDELVDFETAEEFLLHFSRIGQVSFVKKLITLRDSNEVPLNINCKGESKSNYGWTPLHLAAYFGHADVVEVLLDNGADVDIQNEEGDTSLHKAAYTAREQIVVQLIAHQANVFLINGDGLRPYELTQSGTIRQLLAAAEKSDIRRREDKFLSSARTGDVAILKKLLEDTICPVDINCVDTSGNTALHCAAYRGQNEAVIFLLKNGIDTTIKNNRGQMASNLATTISLKQLIQEVHLSVMTPKAISSLKNRSVSRYEGLLFRKGRFFGWKLNWAVLERGVFSFFANRADATTGARRKGYKYLEGAMTEVVAQSDNPLSFIIIFGDRSRAMFCLPKSQSELDLQKWISAINDHIYFGTNFIKQGTFIDDSDDEDEAAKLLSSPSVQDMILTANAHQKILEKHIGALQQLLDDESLFASGNFEESINDDSIGTVHSSQGSLHNSTVLSIKFHLNLILESSRNSSSSLTQCLNLISRQNEARQHQIRQEQEKVRVLEEALQLFAREHHDLERSVLTNSLSMSTAANNTVADSLQLSTGQSRSRPAVDRVRSIGCISQSTTTDMDEFFDAFDDMDDEDGDFLENLSEKTIAGPDQIDNDARFCSDHKMNEFLSLDKTSKGEFLTAQDATINDSLSTLSIDDDENKTLASDDIPYYRERLPAPMVPRDEVGLWSILKHCIGKELSKITFPVVFNEPLSFLQRMAEIFQHADYLNIADQCDNIVERMENVSAFIVSAYSSNWLRLNKPFNPLLGETFEYEIASSETRVVFEQVSHHPPISAWHAESPHFVLRGTICPKLKFWGKSIEVKPEGSITLNLKSKGEVYTWKSVNCCVHNIIVGKLWFEQYGTIEVHNRTNNYKVNLNFKSAGWFGYDLNRFEGFILNANKEKVRFLYGKWNDYLKSAAVEDYDDYLKANNNKFRAPDKPTDDLGQSTPRKLISKFTKQLTGVSIDTTNNNDDIESTPPKNLPPEEPNGDIPKSDSSHSLDISNSRILWKVQPRPDHSPEYYHFNSFTFGLNELPSDSDFIGRLPTTDSRFRPDIRKLEEGDLDAAASEKNRLEEKQREARRLRKKRREKDYEPLWFRLEVNQLTREDDWQFTGNYWQRDWSRCPDIF